MIRKFLKKNIKKRVCNKVTIFFSIFFLILGFILLHNQKVVAQTPPTTLTCGQIITGTIVMSGNLDCSNYTGHAINMSGNSSLDLSGYTITAKNGWAGISATNVNNFTITNGTIKSDSYSIYLQAVGSETGAVNISNLNLSSTTGTKVGYGSYTYARSDLPGSFITQNLHFDNLVINNRSEALHFEHYSAGNKYENISISGVVATGNTYGLNFTADIWFGIHSGLKLFNNNFSNNDNGAVIKDISNVEAARNTITNTAGRPLRLLNVKGIIPTSPSSDMAFDLRNNVYTLLISAMNNFNIFGTNPDLSSPSTEMYMTEGAGNLSGWKILFDASNDDYSIELLGVGSATGAVNISNLNLSKSGTKLGYGIYTYAMMNHSYNPLNYITQNLHFDNLVINNRVDALHFEHYSAGNKYENISISGVVATGNTYGLNFTADIWFGVHSGLKLFNNNFSNNDNGAVIKDISNVEAARNTITNTAGRPLRLLNVKGIIPTSPSSDMAFDLRNNVYTLLISAMNNFNIFGTNPDLSSPSTEMYMTEGAGNLSGWKILFDTSNDDYSIELIGVGSMTGAVNISNLNLSSTSGTKQGYGIYTYAMMNHSYNPLNYITQNLHFDNLVINNRVDALHFEHYSVGNKYENISISGVVATGNTYGLNFTTDIWFGVHSGLKLFNNNFSNNSSYGVNIVGFNNVEVAGNTIKNNTVYGMTINTTTNFQFYSNIISGNTLNFQGDTGYTLGINERGHIYNSGSCFSRSGHTVGGIPADANRSDIIAPPICAATTLSCLGGCGFTTRSNVVQDFDYGVSRKSSVVPGTSYPLMLLFTNTSVSSVTKVTLPGGFILPVTTPIAPGASSNINLNIKYFVP